MGILAAARGADRGTWLVALAGVCVVLFVLLYVLAVRTPWGQRAGNAALAGRFNQPPPVVVLSTDLLATISVASLGGATVIIALIGFARGGLRLAIGASAVIVGANVLTRVLKLVVLDRPPLSEAADRFGAHNSFPSGHATVAISLAVALLLVVPAGARLYVAIPACLVAFAVGAATVAAGWHRPSDVMGAFLMATAWGAAIATLLLAWDARSGSGRVWDERLVTERLPLWLGSGIVAGAALGLALLAWLSLVVNRAWADLRTPDFDIAYLAGVLATVAAGIVLVSALLAPLAGLDLAD